MAPKNKQADNTIFSLTEHLIELRSRLIKILIALIILILLLAPFAREIYTYIAQPLILSLPTGNKMIATEVLGTILVPLKVIIILAFMLLLPFTLYQIWAFISPGLYHKEKRILFPLVLSSLVLFILGMAFCYFLFFPLLFGISVALTPDNVAYQPDIGNYITFILTMFLIFGFAFEVPIFMFSLNKMGIVSYSSLKNIRAYAIIAAFIVAAIATPPDIISQIFLAIPLILLYEIGLITCKIFGRE